jgi:beta-glucosidase/6-phospho-beta-glucosidase/beta-galactosidase
MEIGIALSHFQISKEIPKEDIWVKYSNGKLPLPYKGIRELKGKDLDDLINILTLEGEIKDIRFSILPSYIEENGKINKEKLKKYKNFFSILKDNNVNILLVLIHYTYPYYWGSVFEKDFYKNVINFIENIKEIFDHIDSITPINEPAIWIYKLLTIKASPYRKYIFIPNKLIKLIKIAKENIKEISNYIWDNYKERTIINNVFALSTKDILNIVKPFLNIYKEFDYLPSHLIGLNYYGTFELFGGEKNFYGDRFSIFKLDTNNLEKIIIDYRKRTGKDVIITEIGMSANNKEEEEYRIKYFEKVFDLSLRLGIRKVYIWSSTDNFEWEDEYKKKFGVCYSLEYDGFKKKEICNNFIELINKYK